MCSTTLSQMQQNDSIPDLTVLLLQSICRTWCPPQQTTHCTFAQLISMLPPSKLRLLALFLPFTLSRVITEIDKLTGTQSLSIV